jgi:hypothetical protein
MRWQRFRNLYAEGDRRRRGLWLRLLALLVSAKVVFWLTAWLSGGHWQLAVMATVVALTLPLLLFVLLGGLSSSVSPAQAGSEAHPPQPAEKSEQREPAAPAGEGGAGAAEGTAAMVDRYYFKGAWFRVTIHPKDEEGHRIDLAGPLCSKCHEPMLRAREREPLEKLGEGRTEVYKCHKSTLHPQISAQLSGKDDLVEQARSACLHDIATGRFASDLSEAGEAGTEGETGGSPEEATGAADADADAADSDAQN